MDRTSDIFTALTDDHSQVSGLFDEIEGNANNFSALGHLFRRLHELLELHSLAEEAVVYAALNDKEETADYVTGSIEDHTEIRRKLEQLHEIRHGSEEWFELIHELNDLVEQHVDLEEGEIFDEMRAAFSQRELEEMGARFLEAKRAAEEPSQPAA